MKEPLLNDDSLADYVRLLPANKRTFIFDASKTTILIRESIQNVIDEYSLDGGPTKSGVFLIDNDSRIYGRLDEIFDEDFLISLQDNGVKIVL